MSCSCRSEPSSPSADLRSGRRPINPTAAYATATFGLVNAVAVMASGAFMAAANAVVANASLAPGGDAAGTVGLLFALSASAWGMGNIFFGLWLIPMGWVAVTSGRFPRVLGWILSWAAAATC